jgi:hypothetical protein
MKINQDFRIIAEGIFVYQIARGENEGKYCVIYDNEVYHSTGSYYVLHYSYEDTNELCGMVFKDRTVFCHDELETAIHGGLKRKDGKLIELFSDENK